ncbi:hypothetical protein NV379_12415 [Paenibacillus sp. N1-5-1-14]|uniref:hypothetical protein n=1 Tax=Paenibacillus radicibacter TaxID=2972488 RepID=UPI0021598CCF|nr:hypothetical protein [Paenibacillus radicibacter]MCR8643456.1 hypothetical protein [Paenibacillus radicibacter]
MRRRLLPIIVGIIILTGGLWLWLQQSDEATNAQLTQGSATYTPPADLPAQLANFKPEYVEDGAKSKYDLSLKMNERGDFIATAKITVTNASIDSWDKLVFYMIPNVFAEKGNKMFQSDAKLTIEEVKLAGKKVKYTLEDDNFTVPLVKKLDPKGST